MPPAAKGRTPLKPLSMFPDADRHCAYLAAAAVREAVHRWMIQHADLLPATAPKESRETKA